MVKDVCGLLNRRPSSSIEGFRSACPRDSGKLTRRGQEFCASSKGSSLVRAGWRSQSTPRIVRGKTWPRQSSQPLCTFPPLVAVVDRRIGRTVGQGERSRCRLEIVSSFCEPCSDQLSYGLVHTTACLRRNSIRGDAGLREIDRSPLAQLPEYLWKTDSAKARLARRIRSAVVQTFREQ